MSARSRLLERLALFVRRRYRAVFVGAALVFALAGLLTSRLHFDTDVLHLLPKNDPAVRTFTDTIAQFESLDNLLVVVGFFNALPRDVSVLEVEPEDEGWGEGLSHVVEAAWPRVIDGLRELADVKTAPA